MDKRGQGLPISTIILLILGIVILVFLILGFSMGWDKFSSYFSKNNVQEVVTNCNVACSLDASGQYDFCFSKRDLTSETEKLKEVTCYYLSLNKIQYGIAECASITCPVEFVELNAGETLDSRCTSSNAGKTVQTLVKNVLQSKECPVATP